MQEAVSALGSGLLAGWGVAVPLGAIGVLVIDSGRRCGFRGGFAAGLGVATADLLYAALAAAAGAAVAPALAPAQSALRLLSAAVLAGVAVLALRTAGRAPQAPAQPAPPAGRTWLRFTAITLVNPTTAAYFVALTIGLPGIADGSAATRGAFVFGAFSASLSWQTALAAGGSALHRLPARAHVWTGLLGGAVALAFALRTALAA